LDVDVDPNLDALDGDVEVGPIGVVDPSVRVQART